MSTTTLPTPADLTITPRDRKFGRGELSQRLWHGGRVEATAIYNALSTTFPVGEAFFVESVRAFRDGAPPKLADQYLKRAVAGQRPTTQAERRRHRERGHERFLLVAAALLTAREGIARLTNRLP